MGSAMVLALPDSRHHLSCFLKSFAGVNEKCVEFEEMGAEGMLEAAWNEEMCVRRAWVSALLLPCARTPTFADAVCLQTRTRILPPSRRSVSQSCPCASPRTLLRSGGG